MPTVRAPKITKIHRYQYDPELGRRVHVETLCHVGLANRVKCQRYRDLVAKPGRVPARNGWRLSTAGRFYANETQGELAA